MEMALWTKCLHVCALGHCFCLFDSFLFFSLQSSWSNTSSLLLCLVKDSHTFECTIFIAFVFSITKCVEHLVMYLLVTCAIWMGMCHDLEWLKCLPVWVQESSCGVCTLAHTWSSYPDEINLVLRGTLDGGWLSSTVKSSITVGYCIGVYPGRFILKYGLYVVHIFGFQLSNV